MNRRTRYQSGTIQLSKRQNAPDVSEYRWREHIGGEVIRRSVVVGSVEKYPTEALASIAAGDCALSLTMTHHASDDNP